MATATQTCPSCGALAGSTRICTFCGTLLIALVDIKDEKEALNDFHRVLAGQTEKNKQIVFLQHGFIPEHPLNLIDAGVRTVALIDFNADEEAGNTAANRLRAITLKLKIMEPTTDVTSAIQEFERVLSKQERIEHRDTVWGVMLIAVLALILLGGCLFGISLLFGS